MKIINSIDEFREWRKSIRGSLAFVPTMGALHEGHLSLMKVGKSIADHLAVSVFVNPTQFGPNEDLDKYPRDIERDQELCKPLGVECIFYPTPDMMYPNGFCSWVDVEGLTDQFEGAKRPGHFRGVTTVVLKLFNIVQPDKAIFGWKDAQQFIVLNKMVQDLNLPIEMIGSEIIREPHGLAMSSRNEYLSDKDRTEAAVLNQSLLMAKELIEQQDDYPIAFIKDKIREKIETECSGEIDYIAIVSKTNLQPIEQVEIGNTLIAIAVRFGETRLLDNIRI